MVGCTLPPGALAILDSLVGTFLGTSRSELTRFIVVSWITDHHTEIKNIAEARAEQMRKKSTGAPLVTDKEEPIR